MKLSEMSTEQFADAICDVTDATANIVEDKALMIAIGDVFKRYEGKTVGNMLATALRKVVPLMLKTHRHDTFQLVAAMNQKTLEQVMAQPIMQTIDDINGMVDKELLDFFTQLKQAAKTES